MANSLGELVYTLTLNDSGFESKLNSAKNQVTESSDQMAASNEKVGSSSEKAGGFFSSMAGQFLVGSAIFTVAQKGLDMLKGVIDDGVQAQKDWQTAQAQMQAGLKSTKDISGMTADALSELAKKTQDKTAIDKAAVLTGENMLLTFTGIGKQVFPQATQAVADMATRMNGGAVPTMQQMNNTALQLGKALNDPATGMMMLRREGVTFSAEQQKTIKSMEKAGDTMGAQKLMLAELNKEFGGSAAAAAQTYQGRVDQLKNKLNDLVGQGMEMAQHALVGLGTWFMNVLPSIEKFGSYIGSILKPILSDIAEFFKLFWEVLSGGDPTITSSQSKFAGLASFMANDVQPIVDDIKTFFSLLWQVMSGGDPTIDSSHLQFIGIVKVMDNVKTIIGEVANILKQVFVTAWQILKQAIAGLMPSIEALIKSLVSQLGPAIVEIYQAFIRMWNAINPALMDALKIIAVIVGVALYAAIWLAINAVRIMIDILVDWIHIATDVEKWVANIITFFGDLVTSVGADFDAWHHMYQTALFAAENFSATIVSFFMRIPSDILNAAKSFGSLLFNVGKDLVQGLINGIENMASNAVNSVKNVGKNIVNAAKDALKIFSPSQVFADIGQNVSLGLAGGITQGSDKAIQATQQMTKSVITSGSTLPSTINNQTSSSVGGTSYNFAGANFNFHTAAAVDEFFNIGNRNITLEGNGIAPLAGTTGI